MCLLSAYCGLKINLWLEDSWRVTFDVSEVIFFLISCFCSLCICYLVAIHFTFIWIVPVVYLLCLWPKNLCLFKSDGQSTGMVCTGAISQIVKTCSSGQIHYRNMHHRFHWKVSFWCDDWWFLNLHKKISLSEATIALKHLFTCTRSCVK